ncbi:MAG: hypothetical protein ACRDDF_11335 [Aeromonas sp.]
MSSKYSIKRLVAQLRLNGNLTVSMYELHDGRWLVGYGHHEVITATSTLAAEEFNTCVTHAMSAEGLIETNEEL